MRKSATTLASLLLGAVAWTACSTGDNPTVTEPSLVDQSTLPSVTQHCPDGGKKTEVNDGFTSTTKYYSYPIGKICVKAGTKAYSTSYNGTFGYGCYKVWGLGTKYIKIKETGYSGCKDISYFVVYKKKYY
jgi:hypothetical protein